MPYIHITASNDLSTQTKNEILEEIAAFLPTLPGKNRNNAMIQIDGDRFMAMGEPGTPCVFAEIRLCGASPEAAKEQFASYLTELLVRKTGTAADHVYLNYFEMDHWGLNGTIVHV